MMGRPQYMFMQTAITAYDAYSVGPPDVNGCIATSKKGVQFQCTRLKSSSYANNTNNIAAYNHLTCVFGGVTSR